MYELMVETTFDAAHQLREHGGKCENLHGHTWKVQVFVAGELNELGMVIDFQKIKEILKDVINEYDHQFLNNLDDFKIENPTAENIAKNLAKKIREKLAEIKNLGQDKIKDVGQGKIKDVGQGFSLAKLTKVTVWESPTTAATYFC